jgi:disulfide bond formation protein DsbB
MRVMRTRFWGITAAVASAAALAVAHGSETWAGLVPCALCLVERWPYRVAFVLGLVVAFSPSNVARWAMLVLTLTVAAGLVTAAIHVGVEWHWWPSPLPECAAPKFVGGSIAERLAHMPAVPAKPCEDPSYLFSWLPLSFVTMHFLFASVLTAVLAAVSIRGFRKA